MWDKLVPLLFGTLVSTQANQRAADTASRATLQGAQLTADAIREGNQQAQDTLETQRRQAAPATAYLRQTVASPTELTPEQQAQLEETRRAVAGTIHNSSFAGSGRTASALFRQAEADFVNRALTDNAGRADRAATTLHGDASTATRGIANSQASTGQMVGKAIGEGTARAGLYDAAGGLASGRVAGEAIGQIGSLINSEKRQSRYGDRMAEIEKALKGG